MRSMLRQLGRLTIIRVLSLFLGFAVCFSVFSPAALAQSSLAGKVRKIEVRGNKKIEKDAVLARVKAKEGEAITEAGLKDDLVSLFKTGFFYDVKIQKENSSGGSFDLIYQVVEKPTIAEIVFEGNSELKTEELLENSGLKAFEILNMGKLRDAVDKLQKMYEDKGYFLAKIDAQTEDVAKDETVKIVFRVTENDKVKVRKITFLGNKRLKDSFIKGRLMTNEAGYFSFMSGSGGYKQDAFDRDVQMIRLLYLNEGFVQAKVDRPQVYVTPDKKNIYITIRIDEGEQYEVGEVDFSGDILFPRDELSTAIEINKRKVFSYEVVQRDLMNLQAKYGDLGYAYTNVEPGTRVNEKERRVDLTYKFDKGNKVYFGTFTVTGNSKTRDKVVRREMKIKEGELYNETRKRESLENIQRLGFFEEVNFRTSTPAENQDVQNIDIVVKERNTGQIQLGAGYGSVQGFTLQGSVQQSNFLGKGQSLSAGIRYNNNQSEYNLDFAEPYFADTDWSLGAGLSKALSSREDYSEERYSANIRLGHPLGENLRGTIKYKMENTQFSRVYWSQSQPVPAWAPITDESIFQLDKARGITSSISGILEYDKRNDRFSPSKGIYGSVAMEYAGLGGSQKYTKGSATARYFNKIFWDVIWRNNLVYGFIQSHDPSQPPPFNELYLLGGPFSLRGYRFGSVGRYVRSQVYRDYLDQRFPSATYPDWTESRKERAALRPLGGTKQVMYQMEFEFPLIAEAGIKGVMFYDIGQAADELTNDNYYSDIGLGFRWFSPIGPLRFEWGFPLRTYELSDDPVVFEFTIGSPF